MRSCFLLTVSGCLLVATLGLHAGDDGKDPGIFAKDAKPELVLENNAGEGPAWHAKLGLLFSGPNGIGRLDREGKFSLWRKKAGTNGLLFDKEQRLICCEPAQRRVTRIDTDGNLVVLTDKYNRQRYNQPNDVTVDSQGRIYFTDPCYGDRKHMELTDQTGRKVEGVYRIDRDGTVTRLTGPDEVDRPNGIRASANDKYLYIADNNNNAVGGARKLWRFDLKADGSLDLTSRKLLFDWGKSRGPDGIKMDVKGRLYVAGGLNKANLPAETADNKGGIYVFSPEGKLLHFLHIDRDEVTNCAFGGDDAKTLYITAGGTLWKIRTTTAGYTP
jgi:gluconolactonase